MAPEVIIGRPIAAHAPAHHAAGSTPRHHVRHTAAGTKAAPETLCHATMKSAPHIGASSRWRPPSTGGVMIMALSMAGPQRERQ
ncbi:hypothetical protein [Komagataeibacter melaceti]|uniref:hypothetical protein n=1 Tax=Komagataeibacter melaceti TaxID=2766577 RepID=UPI001313E1F9|nr:hypothetical protein [Komagataeibacter melaceti]